MFLEFTVIKVIMGRSLRETLLINGFDYMQNYCKLCGTL